MLVFKKEYTAFYLPPVKPVIVDFPKANYIAVRGKGNPNPDFIQYIIDQCSDAGEISVKKMGDYCAYCNGILFGLICDNNFFVKVTEPGRAVLKEVILRPPYDDAKDYFYINDVDDRDYLATLIKATIPALPKPKKNPMLERKKHVPSSLDEVIPQCVICSQELRTFFQRHIGQGFHFKVEFQKWLHENAGKTYGDAVEAYNTLEHPTEIWPQFEYNQYVRDFFADNKGASLNDAIRCRKWKKMQPGNHRYKRSDLES